MSPAGSAPAAGRVEVFAVEHGAWRWRYVDDEAGVELVSNLVYPDRDAAEHSAAIAYPDLEPVGPREPEPPQSPRRGRVAAAAAGAAGVAAIVWWAVAGRRLRR